jgi:hypothetical protein
VYNGIKGVEQWAVSGLPVVTQTKSRHACAFYAVLKQDVRRIISTQTIKTMPPQE